MSMVIRAFVFLERILANLHAFLFGRQNSSLFEIQLTGEKDTSLRWAVSFLKPKSTLYRSQGKSAYFFPLKFKGRAWLTLFPWSLFLAWRENLRTKLVGITPWNKIFASVLNSQMLLVTMFFFSGNGNSFIIVRFIPKSAPNSSTICSEHYLKAMQRRYFVESLPLGWKVYLKWKNSELKEGGSRSKHHTQIAG